MGKNRLCFVEKTFQLKNITVLTGSNGTGKSSFIQALLLIRSSIEKNCADSNHVDYQSKIWKNASIPLNGPYQLNLGSLYDIFNDTENATNVIRISLADEIFNIKLPLDETQNDRVTVNIEKTFKGDSVHIMRKQKFYYLNTERLGPRLGVDSIYTDFPHCYYRGENTAEIISSYGVSIKIFDQRQNTEIKSNNLEQQVEAWLNAICPGTLGIQVQKQDLNRYQIMLRSSAAKNHILAPNIGFGISYALPIIVNGLIAEPDSFFIVENPEAHLHPKGQSKMGYFLGMVAAAGIRVIIETNSEHIVNGIRIASLQGAPLRPDNVGIYFFEDLSKNKDHTKEININSTGDLESFPKDPLR